MAGEAETTAESIGLDFGGGVLNDAVESKVNDRFEWVLDDIADTSRDDIRQVIIDGLDEGRNPRRVAADIRKKFDEHYGASRARLIGRTEMLSATNAGTWTAHRESDVVKMRSWLSTRDGNVRPDHTTLDQQTSSNPIGVEDPFTIAGSQAMHPGDFGVARLDCNCRCTTVAEFPDRSYSEEQRYKLWVDYAKRLLDYEQQAAEIARQGFGQQRDRVLAEFTQVFDVELEEVAA